MTRAVKTSTKVETPTPNFQVGQKLISHVALPTIVGKTSKGLWVVEESDCWGDDIQLSMYTTAELKKKYKVVEG